MRELRRRLRLGAGVARRVALTVSARRPPRGQPRVSYGFARLPGEDEPASGGIVKFQRLDRVLPNSPTSFNVLYLGSSSPPPGATALALAAKARGAAFVWNQNGVAYPAWAGPATARVNAPMRRLLHRADYVFFQSDFCKTGSDRFLGRRRDAWEVLYNSVDTSRFAPSAEPRGDRPLTLLLGGSQYQWYRVDAALGALAAVRRELPDARLLVSGRLSWAGDDRRAESELRSRAAALGVGDAVELGGAFTQRDAPALYARADILLHTKVNDPCPSAVIEAMACGVPVVYAQSGGTPELVGGEGGVGVSSHADWDEEVPPGSDDLAAAVFAVRDRLEDYRAAARERARTRFDLQPWIERHRLVFEELVR